MKIKTLFIIILTLLFKFSYSQSKIDSIKLCFNSDSVDLFIEYYACWDHYTTIVNLRKISPTKMSISYNGGKPYTNKISEFDTSYFSRTKQLLISTKQDSTYFEGNEYIVIYIQCFDKSYKFKHVEFVHHPLFFDKNLRKLLKITLD